MNEQATESADPTLLKATPGRWKLPLALTGVAVALYLMLQFCGTTADWDGPTAYICPDLRAAEMSIPNLLVLACCVLVFVCITGRFWSGTVLAAIPWVLVAIAHHVKLQVMHMPLVPLDLRRTMDVLPMGWAALNAGPRLLLIVGPLMVVGLAMLLDRWLPLVRWTRRRRLSVGVASACFLLLVPASASLVSRTGLFMARRWDWGHCYRQDGFALSFLAFSRDLVWRQTPTLPGYSQRAVNEVCKRITSTFGPATTVPGGAPAPDVVIVLIESLVDPTWMTNLEFASDPLANLHQLQRECGVVRAISPTFAGNSVNTDFEVLTGLDASHLPPEVMAITDDMDQPAPSLARLFRAYGYQTSALAPTPPALFGYGWFFPVGMGFEHYRDAQSLGGAGVDGTSDLSMADSILQTLDTGGATPQFIYAQFPHNHYPWTRGKFDHPQALPRHIPDCDDASALGIYLQGVYESDQAIGLLAQGLRQRSRPAILVLFGDHLPGFTNQTYRQVGLLAGDETPREQHEKLHTVPSVIWSTLAPPAAARTLRMNQLAPPILRLVGVKHPFYTGFLATPNETDRSLLQFDLLHGARYSEPLFSPP